MSAKLKILNDDSKMEDVYERLEYTVTERRILRSLCATLTNNVVPMPMILLDRACLELWELEEQRRFQPETLLTPETLDSVKARYTRLMNTIDSAFTALTQWNTARMAA